MSVGFLRVQPLPDRMQVLRLEREPGKRRVARLESNDLGKKLSKLHLVSLAFSHQHELSLSIHGTEKPGQKFGNAC